MNNDDKFITITDEEGNDHLAEVLFTFENEGESYVLMTLVEEFENAKDMEYDVLAYKYEELENGIIGNLIEIPESDQDSWNVVSEMFETFNDSNFEM